FADAIVNHDGDVWNHLNSCAHIIAAPFLQNDSLVNLAAGEIVVPREHAIGESLVMAKIEISLRAVIEHVDFAVLKRIHRSGIDIEIRIKLLEYNTQTARFEQRS